MHSGGGGGGGGSSCIPRRDDWICQPAGTLITLAISRLTSHNRSHLWDGMISAILEARSRDKACDSNLQRGKGEIERCGRRSPNSVFPLENFVLLWSLKAIFFPVSFSKTTMANNKGSDVNHHFWARKQRKLAVRKFSTEAKLFKPTD